MSTTFPTAIEALASFLVSSPDASVSDCARHLNNLRLSIGRSHVAEARRLFRRQRHLAGQSQPATPPESPLPPVAPAAVVEPKSTSNERRAYVLELLEANPGLHPDDLKTQLRTKYGVAVAVDFVYLCCRVARVQAGLEQLPERTAVEPVSPTTRQPLPPIAAPGMTAQDALRAVAVALKEVGAAYALDAVLTLKGGHVDTKFDLLFSGAFEI